MNPSEPDPPPDPPGSSPDGSPEQPGDSPEPPGGRPEQPGTPLEQPSHSSEAPGDWSELLPDSPETPGGRRFGGEPPRERGTVARPAATGIAAAAYPRRYGRYVGLLGLAIAILLGVNAVVTKQDGAKGIEPGHTVPPFAAPLAVGRLNGDVNVATHADEGTAGRIPACAVRGPGVLNVCELYDRGPLVLALFVDGGSCAEVLGEMQSLAGSYAGVSFAAVAIKGERAPLLKLIGKQGLTSVLVGFDSDGVLAALYKVASCPQVSLILPGGRVQSPALLGTPSRQVLAARVSALVAAARARGWRPAG
jgi:hypothetical protein